MGLLAGGASIAFWGAVFMLVRMIPDRGSDYDRQNRNMVDISGMFEALAPYFLGVGILMMLIGGLSLVSS